MQRYRSRGAPFPTHKTPTMPKKSSNKPYLVPGPKARLRRGTFEKPRLETLCGAGPIASLWLLAFSKTLGMLVQVPRNGYFLHCCPQRHPVLRDSGLGQVGQSLRLTLLPPKPLPRRPPKHGEFLRGFSW